MKDLFNNYITNKLEDIYLNQISDLISNLNTIEFSNVKNNFNYLSITRNKQLQSIHSYLSNNYFRILNIIWNITFKLGTKHTILDILYNLPSLNRISFKTILDNVQSKSSFSGYIGTNNIAEFILSEAEKKRREKISISRSSEIGSKLNNKQRRVFQDSLQEINNTVRKSEASKKDFIGSEYMKRRLRVLSNDYANSNDREIRKTISKYLKNELNSIQRLRDTKVDVNNLRKEIQADLRKKGLFKQKGTSGRAFTILRTELNLAYNFGKLSGFTGSEEDLDRKVMWNADWEMQKKIPNYVVCSYCKKMNGKVFTVSKLLQMGVILDRGILNYKGASNTKTSFKNPSIPMIPGHPGCSCFWVVLPKKTKLQAEEEDTSGLNKVLSTGLTTIAGVGLLVGAGFLVSRSGLFKQFIKSSVKSPSKLANTLVDSSQILDSPAALNTVQELSEQGLPRPKLHPLIEEYLNSPMVESKPFLVKNDLSVYDELMKPSISKSSPIVDKVTKIVSEKVEISSSNIISTEIKPKSTPVLNTEKIDNLIKEALNKLLNLTN